MRTDVKDETGKIYGRWTVIRRDGSKRHPTGTSASWLCRCVCGKEKVVDGPILRNGQSTSCGCSRKRLGAPGAIFTNYKNKAKRRGLSWELSFEDFLELIQDSCSYCGTASLGLINYRGDPYSYNGIDRFDNDKGYSWDNCHTCCKICNRAKGELTIVGFGQWVDRISEHKRFILG